MFAELTGQYVVAFVLVGGLSLMGAFLVIGGIACEIRDYLGRLKKRRIHQPKENA